MNHKIYLNESELKSLIREKVSELYNRHLYQSRINEDRLRRIIRETFRRSINEEDDVNVDETNQVQTSYVFRVSSVGEESEHFRNKIFQLKKMAQSIGGDLKVDIKQEKDSNGHEYTSFEIIPTMPILQVNGYKYLGSVVPASITLKDGNNLETNLVTVSKEFQDNQEAIDILKKSSARMKCDGCHRETSRGIYYCFFEEKTGEIKKFGSSCASRYFGINVGTKLQNLFKGLDLLGDTPYVEYDENGNPVGSIRNPVTSDIFGNMGSGEYLQFSEMVTIACMAIAKYGVNCKMKNCMDVGRDYIEIKHRCKNSATGRNGLNTQLYQKYLSQAKAEYPELFQIYEESRKYYNDFFSNAADFFTKFEPNKNSSFEMNLKNIGLLIGGARIQKKQIGKFNYMNFIPYCVAKYFNSEYQEEKDDNQVSNINTAKRLEYFSGDKLINVTVDSIETRYTRYNSPYWYVLGTTENNELAKWCVFKNEPSYKEGDKIGIVASYNENYGTLDNVRLWCNYRTDKTVNFGDINKVEKQEKPINFPADGTRYKNEEFSIIRLNPNYFIVKNTNDNCEYFVSNRVEAFGYYDRPHPKFDLSSIKEGDKVKLSATVKSYNGRNGVGHKLERVIGLPKWTNNENEDENDYEE